MASFRTIGRFEIEGERGSGGSGTVYAGRDPGTGMRVAVKLFRGLGAAEVARFRREAETLAQLRHPGVVRYVDHGQIGGGTAYLVMELLDGEDLRARLARGLLSFRETALLGQRIADALAAVHAHRLVHRDIKPGNIFLPGGKIGDATLVDFGLVRPNERGIDTDVTATGIVVGTPAYMSPEQARGQRGIDGRADIFALGCVLYRCIAGRAPFEAKHVVAVLTKVILEQPPPLRTTRPDVPGPLSDLIGRMLEKDPERRPASAGVVARALAALAPTLNDDQDSADDDIEPPPSSRSGLTTHEMRIATVLMLSPSSDADPSRFADVVRSITEEHSARSEGLRDGTQVITRAGDPVVSDQAARVAEIALSVRSALPDATIAIATGRADVGRQRLIGDAIERAAALLSSAKNGRIALDEVTASLIDLRFEIERSRGETWLTGARVAESPVRTVLGRVTPMVGREWEMRSIETFFRECVEEPAARPLLVTGAAGMGKSRLAFEAVSALRRIAPSAEVWWARGDPMRTETPLGMLAQVIRSAFGALDRGSHDARWQRLAQVLKARVPQRDAERMAALLLDAAGATVSPGLRPLRRDSAAVNDQLGAAWQALVDATCSARPLILVLNDLHWADAPTVQLIASALTALPNRPWFVLGLARSEVHEQHPGLWSAQGVQELRLRALSKRACIDLAREVLGDRADPDLLDSLAVRADGNAFYLEELIRAVGTSLATLAPMSDLPESVLGMVQARLAGLDAETRRILRAASIFGEAFWLGGIAALLGGSQPRAGVELLIHRELVSPSPTSRFPGETELVFRHALLREGAYAMLTPADRANGHALAAQWLEQRGETDAAVLAHHLELSGDHERAAHFFQKAATQALAAGDLHAASGCAEKALPRLRAGPERLACLRLLGEAGVWQQEWSAADARGNELATLATPGSELWFWGQALRAVTASALGRSDALADALTVAAATEPGIGAEASAVLVAAQGVLLLGISGQLQWVRAQAQRAAAILDRSGTSDPLAQGWAELSQAWVSSWIDGNTWAARRYARIACGIFEEAHVTRLARFARIFVALSEQGLGLLDIAEAQLRALCIESNDPLLSTIATRSLTVVLLERGALEDARALAEARLSAVRSSPRADSVIHESDALWMLGSIASRNGDLALAEQHLLASVEGLRSLPPTWVLAASELASVYLAQGRSAEALALSDEALEVSARMGEQGARSIPAQVVYAESLRATGQGDTAREALRGVLDLLRERADAIDDPALRQRFLSNRPENAKARKLGLEWGVKGL